MLLPSKHISLPESIFVLGFYLLSLIDRPMTLQEIWNMFSKVNHTPEYPAYHGFENVVLALDFLYCINAIEYDESGLIYNATN